MSKTGTFVAIGAVVVLIAGMVIWGVIDGRQKNPGEVAGSQAPDAAIVEYYGAECPHCQRIQEFLDTNHVADKVQFTQKEVWHDAKNSDELTSRAKSLCGLDSDKIGVPLVIADGKCYVGEDEVTSLFKEKAGIQ